MMGFFVEAEIEEETRACRVFRAGAQGSTAVEVASGPGHSRNPLAPCRSGAHLRVAAAALRRRTPSQSIARSDGDSG
jgi:hypothetical protein